MKLRCVHNSIRLRLRKSDLKELHEQGRIKEEVNFLGKQALVFSLHTQKELSQPLANFEQGEIKIILPEKQAHSWINSNITGIEHFQELPQGEQLQILIEKDFPCKDREGEDINDTFWELAGEEPDKC